MRQRLDVLHEGGAALQAAFGHSGRLPQWDRDAPSDPVDNSAGLAGDEAVSSGHDAKLRAVKPESADVLPTPHPRSRAPLDGRP